MSPRGGIHDWRRGAVTFCGKSGGSADPGHPWGDPGPDPAMTIDPPSTSPPPSWLGPSHSRFTPRPRSASGAHGGASPDPPAGTSAGPGPTSELLAPLDDPLDSPDARASRSAMASPTISRR